jgi:hypothetical protein
MIDINGRDAWMIPGDLETQPFGEFLEKIISFIIPELSQLETNDGKLLLDKLFLVIKEELNK